MISKLAALLLGVTGFGLTLAVQDYEPPGASNGALRTARMVRPDHSSPAAAPASTAPATKVSTTLASSPNPSDAEELRQENRRLSAKIEQLETRVKELLAARQPPVRDSAGTHAQPPQDQDLSPRRTVRTRRADQGTTGRDASPNATERKLAEVQRQVEQSQREVKEVAEQRAAALARAAGAEKQRDELAESLISARREREVAKIDTEAAASACDEALRTADDARKEREDAVRVADQALKQAKEAAGNRNAAVSAAMVAQADRDQARAQAVAAQQARDTAQRISQELQRQRLAAYDEAKAARAEIMPARQALAVAERLAEERRQSLQMFRSAEHQWAQFAVQLASAVGVTDPLPPQDERWSAREAATQAWLDKVRVRYAQVLVPVARPSEADRTGANFSYVEGLRHMRQQDYRAAVERFTEAIDRFPQDARYFYLRGMARHLAANGTEFNEAERDVRRGAELEKQNSPGSRTVDQALERLQGAARLWAEKFRR